MTRAVVPTTLACAVALLTGCGDDPGATDDRPTLTVEELMKPETCQDCHADHYREWASSMHAYAVQDPVFLAMNRRGQEETGGELGDFCIGCHAPMAVELGLTHDGLNLDEVADEFEGVTCYFCHNVESIADQHDNPLQLPANNPLLLANDTVMRGGVADARRPSAHKVAYSRIHDGSRPESGQMCGACHDIVTPAGVHLERTFKEWSDSVFSQTDGNSFDSCIGCHMDSRDGVIANDDDVQVASRRLGFHSHLMPGVDTALTPFPDEDIQHRAIECALEPAVATTLAVQPDGLVTVTLETNVGHGWPSGATQDRRAWLELVAYDADDNIVFEVGRIADDEPVPTPQEDPRLWVMRDRIYGEDGEEVHMFWDASSSERHELGYVSTTLPITRPAPDGGLPPPHYVERTYQTSIGVARVEARVHIRQMGFDVIDDLIESGHLPDDDSIKSELQTFTLHGSQIEWDLEKHGYNRVDLPTAKPLDCPDHWLCALYPDHPSCM